MDANDVKGFVAMAAGGVTSAVTTFKMIEMLEEKFPTQFANIKQEVVKEEDGSETVKTVIEPLTRKDYVLQGIGAFAKGALAGLIGGVSGLVVELGIASVLGYEAPEEVQDLEEISQIEEKVD